MAQAADRIFRGRSAGKEDPPEHPSSPPLVPMPERISEEEGRANADEAEEDSWDKGRRRREGRRHKTLPLPT
jgi:hypothetical protein